MTAPKRPEPDRVLIRPFDHLREQARAEALAYYGRACEPESPRHLTTDDMKGAA